MLALRCVPEMHQEQRLRLSQTRECAACRQSDPPAVVASDRDARSAAILAGGGFCPICCARLRSPEDAARVLRVAEHILARGMEPGRHQPLYRQGITGLSPTPSAPRAETLLF